MPVAVRGSRLAVVQRWVGHAARLAAIATSTSSAVSTANGGCRLNDVPDSKAVPVAAICLPSSGSASFASSASCAAPIAMAGSAIAPDMSIARLTDRRATPASPSALSPSCVVPVPRLATPESPRALLVSPALPAGRAAPMVRALSIVTVSPTGRADPNAWPLSASNATPTSPNCFAVSARLASVSLARPTGVPPSCNSKAAAPGFGHSDNAA